MKKRRFSALLAALFIGLAVPAHAQAEEDVPAAVGDWVGRVSWSEWPVLYAWQINRDGTFMSGRDGRGLDGGGAWSSDGAKLTLKYSDGFRYEGTLRGDDYSGTAYRADGSAFGGFSMSRVGKRFDALDAEE